MPTDTPAQRAIRACPCMHMNCKPCACPTCRARSAVAREIREYGERVRAEERERCARLVEEIEQGLPDMIRSATYMRGSLATRIREDRDDLP